MPRSTLLRDSISMKYLVDEIGMALCGVFVLDNLHPVFSHGSHPIGFDASLVITLGEVGIHLRPFARS